MTGQERAAHPTPEPVHYEIRVAGQLGPEWADWFDGLTITPAPDGGTQLIGVVVDQSALYGLLRKLRDLGLTLLAVNVVAAQQDCLQDDHPNTSGNCS
ncbi:MAG TPA: hypothetical protein GX400_11170 [Chloroflexi bacterium]|nr:hypothetical protein [Chloroflexota bacterium]